MKSEILRLKRQAAKMTVPPSGIFDTMARLSETERIDLLFRLVERAHERGLSDDLYECLKRDLIRATEVVNGE